MWVRHAGCEGMWSGVGAACGHMWDMWCLCRWVGQVWHVQFEACGCVGYVGICI